MSCGPYYRHNRNGRDEVMEKIRNIIKYGHDDEGERKRMLDVANTLKKYNLETPTNEVK